MQGRVRSQVRCCTTYNLLQMPMCRAFEGCQVISIAFCDTGSNEEFEENG